MPFQPDIGSQISDLMSESAEGLIVSDTRQKAGRSISAAGAAVEPPAGGGVKLTRNDGRGRGHLGVVRAERRGQPLALGGSNGGALGIHDGAEPKGTCERNQSFHDSPTGANLPFVSRLVKPGHQVVRWGHATTGGHFDRRSDRLELLLRRVIREEAGVTPVR